MRADTTWNPPRLSLLLRMFHPGHPRPYVFEPLSLAYAWHRAGQDASIATLDSTLRDYARGACPQGTAAAAAGS